MTLVSHSIQPAAATSANPAGRVSRLIYVSQGNIPSRWAHTFQTMKMAEAFARVVPDFRLLTAIQPLMWGIPQVNLREWYGLAQPFRVERLSCFWTPPRRVFHHVYGGTDYVRRAIAYVTAQTPDLVFTRHPWVGRALAARGVPTVIELHTPTEYREFPELLAASREPGFVAAVTLSQPLADRYVAAGLPKERLLVLPDAVDPTRFTSLPDRMEARRMLGLDESVPIAVYSGHLYEEKGIGTVLDAARLAPEIQFVLVGGWPNDVRRCRTQARHCPNVRLVGFVPNEVVPRYLAAADVLLLPNSARFPTAEWTSPLKLFEYMASRRPLVVSDLPVFRLHVRDGHSCCAFAADDPSALAAALRRVVGDADWAQSLAESAHRDVLPHTWENRVRSLLGSLEELGFPGEQSNRAEEGLP